MADQITYNELEAAMQKWYEPESARLILAFYRENKEALESADGLTINTGIAIENPLTGEETDEKSEKILFKKDFLATGFLQQAIWAANEDRQNQIIGLLTQFSEQEGKELLDLILEVQKNEISNPYGIYNLKNGKTSPLNPRSPLMVVVNDARLPLEFRQAFLEQAADHAIATGKAGTNNPWEATQEILNDEQWEAVQNAFTELRGNLPPYEPVAPQNEVSGDTPLADLAADGLPATIEDGDAAPPAGTTSKFAIDFTGAPKPNAAPAFTPKGQTDANPVPSRPQTDESRLLDFNAAIEALQADKPELAKEIVKGSPAILLNFPEGGDPNATLARRMKDAGVEWEELEQLIEAGKERLGPAEDFDAIKPQIHDAYNNTAEIEPLEAIKQKTGPIQIYRNREEDPSQKTVVALDHAIKAESKKRAKQIDSDRAAKAAKKLEEKDVDSKSANAPPAEQKPKRGLGSLWVGLGAVAAAAAAAWVFLPGLLGQHDAPAPDGKGSQKPALSGKAAPAITADKTAPNVNALPGATPNTAAKDASVDKAAKTATDTPSVKADSAPKNADAAKAAGAAEPKADAKPTDTAANAASQKAADTTDDTKVAAQTIDLSGGLIKAHVDWSGKGKARTSMAEFFVGEASRYWARDKDANESTFAWKIWQTNPALEAAAKKFDAYIKQQEAGLGGVQKTWDNENAFKPNGSEYVKTVAAAGQILEDTIGQPASNGNASAATVEGEKSPAEKIEEVIQQDGQPAFTRGAHLTTDPNSITGTHSPDPTEAAKEIVAAQTEPHAQVNAYLAQYLPDVAKAIQADNSWGITSVGVQSGGLVIDMQSGEQIVFGNKRVDVYGGAEDSIDPVTMKILLAIAKTNPNAKADGPLVDYFMNAVAAANNNAAPQPQSGTRGGAPSPS